MKQFIILIGIIPILLIFTMQFTLDSINNKNLEAFQASVYTAKEQAKQDGYFTIENINSLREQISKQFRISTDEIVIEATQIPKYRVNEFNENELIYYKISVPINKIMAGGKLMGIKDSENKGIYTIESYTASERIK